jgi:transcriptional regulator, propionate catabolism operon regulatory protein
MEKHKFAFISNSAELGEAVKSCSNPKTENIIIKLATMEEAIPLARTLLEEKVDVILGGGGTGSLLVQAIGQPVVKISRTHLDIMQALMKAKNHGSSIGVTSFAEPSYGIELFEDILSVKIRQIVFKTTEELKSGISRALKEGVDCIVGGGICKKIARLFGGEGIIVIPSSDVIFSALQEARAIAIVHKKERENTEQLQTILQTIKEGVIVTDNEGKIRIFNQMAADILEVRLQDALEKPLSAVFQGTGMLDVLKTGIPEMEKIRRVKNLDIVFNTIPIVIHDKICGVVATFKEAARIQNIDRKLREELYLKGFTTKYKIDDIKSKSIVMKQLFGKMETYAHSDETILVEGETGTGKELFAQSIHNLSTRKHGPFVVINCSALTESLLESELFGYEEGAFTGAKKGGSIGLFELANGGTIYLDEIADISQNLQAKLLRVLEEKEVMRIGGDRIVPVDVRIVSSTYKDLWLEVKGGKFRTDLFFRLVVFKLSIPPLRDRLEDISPIVNELLYKYSRNTKDISHEMIEQLKEYQWPGNVRELDSFIKRYVILQGHSISDGRLFSDLLSELKIQSEEKQDMNREKPMGIGNISKRALKEQLEDHEKIIINETLVKCHFNKKETAKSLGISVNTLWRKLTSSK